MAKGTVWKDTALAETPFLTYIWCTVGVVAICGDDYFCSSSAPEVSLQVSFKKCLEFKFITYLYIAIRAMRKSVEREC